MAEHNESALITGASSGIGEALAWEFAAQGHDLILVARSVDTLNTLAHKLADKHGVTVNVEQADLSQAGSAKNLAEAIRNSSQRVDILVNCAGVLEHGTFAAISAEDHQRMVQLNVAGLTDILAQFVPIMEARKAGRIMNVSSITAFQPVPSLATYAACKAYVLSLSESLSEELCSSGITVTALCPGFTATNMLAGVGSVGDKIPSILLGEVETVAREGYKACMQGTAIAVPGALNRIAAALSSVTPKWLIRRIIGVVGRSTL